MKILIPAALASFGAVYGEKPVLVTLVFFAVYVLITALSSGARSGCLNCKAKIDACGGCTSLTRWRAS